MCRPSGYTLWMCLVCCNCHTDTVTVVQDHKQNSGNMGACGRRGGGWAILHWDASLLLFFQTNGSFICRSWAYLPAENHIYQQIIGTGLVETTTTAKHTVGATRSPAIVRCCCKQREWNKNKRLWQQKLLVFTSNSGVQQKRWTKISSATQKVFVNMCSGVEQSCLTR